MNKFKRYFLLALSIFLLGEINGQNNLKELSTVFTKASADTSIIAINNRAGWLYTGSYIASFKSDSVIIEMIVQHDRAIDWKQEQLVGRIKQGSMFPKTNQTVSFMLMFDEYLLRVDPNGRCYLRLAKGSIPDGDPVIIPVRAKYKL